MDTVNNVLANAIKDDQMQNLQTLQKIVQKLSLTKATDGPSLTETEVGHWLSYYLPLIFNNDKKIRQEVIRGMELFIPKLLKSKYQQFGIWHDIRKEIVETYSKTVKKLLENNDEEWNVILMLLIKILDGVIANSTGAINTFLAIIELGFRSTDLKIRADAFLCWKVIIEIFIKFDQIDDPKRIKLICIPLKSSRSKTQEIAENKFDVWWTLIQALNVKLVDHSHLIESFIFFCLGPFGKQKEPLMSYFDNNITHLASPGKLFDNIRDLSIAAMIYMLGSPNRSAVRLAKSTNLTFQSNLTICNSAIFEKIGTLFISACMETTVLIAKLDANQSDINECLWESLLGYITTVNAIKYRRFILDGLQVFPKLLESRGAASEPNNVLKQLIVGVICTVVKHPPFLQDASQLEVDEVVGIVNKFSDQFKVSQINSLPVPIRARAHFAQQQKKGTTPGKAGKTPKADKDEYIVIPTVWKMNPEKLTEHQQERMKERRSDIPALYNDMSQSQSQDTFQLKPWNPKQVVIAGDQSHDTVVLNDNSNTKSPKKETRSTTNSKSPKKDMPPPSPQKKENQNVETPGSSSLSKRAQREISNLAIDTIEGRELMKQIPKLPGRRNSLDRGAKATEPAWKKTLLNNKKPRKSRSTSEESNNSKERNKIDSTPKSSAKKALGLSAQNEENVQEIDIKPSPRELKVINNSMEDEAVESSQPLQESYVERRRSRRELQNSTKAGESPKISPQADLDASKSRILRNSTKFDPPSSETLVQNGITKSPSTPVKAQEKTQNTPEKGNTSQTKIPPNSSVEKIKVATPIKTPLNVSVEKLKVATPLKSPQNVSVERVKTTTPVKTSPNVSIERCKMITPVKIPDKQIEVPTNIQILEEQLSSSVRTPIRSSPRKPNSSSGDTQHAIVPQPSKLEAKSTSPTEGSTPTENENALKDLRRSPRKVAIEVTENVIHHSPSGAQMSPLQLTPPVEALKNDNLTPDRRKSPRKSPVVAPVFDENPQIIDDEHQETVSVETLQTIIAEQNAMEDDDEVEYQIEYDDIDEIDPLIDPLANAPSSPAPNLDAELDPINGSMTIQSSPDTSFTTEKTNEFMNNTIDISPITSGKSSPVTRQSLRNQSEQSVSPVSSHENSTKKITRASMTGQVSGIVNLESPKTTNLYQSGRAAHMMNMIFRNNCSTPNQQPGSSKSFTMGPPKPADTPRDILVFSKTLPSADASPSASILKRKLDDTMDDIETSASKRKRVSFHDPPVSITKEYIRHEEEIRSPSVRPPINRCLLMAAVAQQKSSGNSPNAVNQFRYTLKRKGKRESRTDLSKINISNPIEVNQELMSQSQQSQVNIETDSQLLSQDEGGIEQMDDSLTKITQSDLIESKDVSIRFGNKSEVLQYVLNSYPLEDVLETYFETNKQVTPKVARIMTKELSSLMETDSKLRYSILDRLSEKHAIEFLDHAIKENPTKTICERLTLPVILNNLAEKAANDQASKVQILKKFESMITGDEQTEPVFTRQEIITFLINIIPEELSQDETTVILDELLSDKNGAELYDYMTSYFKKYFVSQ